MHLNLRPSPSLIHPRIKIGPQPKQGLLFKPLLYNRKTGQCCEWYNTWLLDDNACSFGWRSLHHPCCYHLSLEKDLLGSLARRDFGERGSKLESEPALYVCSFWSIQGGLGMKKVMQRRSHFKAQWFTYNLLRSDVLHAHSRSKVS